MTINRSNINLQVTRGNKMKEDKYLIGDQKNLPKPLKEKIIKAKIGDGDKVVGKMYGGKVIKKAGGGVIKINKEGDSMVNSSYGGM